MLKGPVISKQHYEAALEYVNLEVIMGLDTENYLNIPLLCHRLARVSAKYIPEKLLRERISTYHKNYLLRKEIAADQDPMIKAARIGCMESIDGFEKKVVENEEQPDEEKTSANFSPMIQRTNRFSLAVEYVDKMQIVDDIMSASLMFLEGLIASEKERHRKNGVSEETLLPAIQKKRDIFDQACALASEFSRYFLADAYSHYFTEHELQFLVDREPTELDDRLAEVKEPYSLDTQRALILHGHRHFGRKVMAVHGLKLDLPFVTEFPLSGDSTGNRGNEKNGRGIDGK